jgi:V/A-type H+-transporting ATPase subunit D
MPDRELVTTRIALLDLAEERRTAREGYALLDEKRMLLAARALSIIEQLTRLRSDYDDDWREALDALRAALERHGVLALETWPVDSEELELGLQERRVLGVALPELAIRTDDAPPTHDYGPIEPSPEIRSCAERFRALLARTARLATLETTLWRLNDEYRRTERRAAAIEHVLLPELEHSIARVEQALEAVDQEEALRVRSAGGRLRTVRDPAT